MDDICYGMLHISDIKKCRIIKKLHAGSLTMGFFLGGGDGSEKSDTCT